MGFTAPSVAGQASVVFEAQQVAGVDAESIGYVEAHGTGTPLGDPIEVSALTEAFRMSTDERGFCALGSVKTNVGHLDTAAGVAGFIKAVLAVERGVIPPSLHFRRPNPEIDFESSPFFVNAELREWSGPSPRRAGVSSFGMGGTNAHVILEQPPAVEPDAGSVADWDVLVTSGKSVDVVSRQRARLGGYLTEYAGRGLSDVAFTLQTGREHHEFRAAVVARSGEDAGRALAGGAGLVSGRALADARVAFLFAGQGSQFMGMGRELFERERVFREVFEECAGVVGAELGEDLGGLLFGDAGELAVSRLGGTRLQQPALFAVQYAMAEQWRAWGVEPCVMLGHSLGEYVAATVAGVWSLGDAVRLVCARGDLMQRQSPGAMLAVSLGEGEARQVAEAAGCVIAAVNSPAQSVLSGPVEAVERAERVVAERQVRHRRLATSHAFHSPMMEPMLKDFERLVSGVEARAPKVPFVSNVTGDWITP
ncbi:type I polyketide synthase, partial [Streptomyces globisporus]|uniref:type I polyketide synthase n=1 Tax=Streptomyces globisporus TaxID=1908 RepID=UPI00296F55AE